LRRPPPLRATSIEPELLTVVYLPKCLRHVSPSTHVFWNDSTWWV
jgi:hypothetical protein